MNILLRAGRMAALMLALLAGSHASPAAAPAEIQAFLGKYCTECHGPEKQKGDRRFDQLTLPVTKTDTLIELQDIIDQLNLGEMPPKKVKQPDAKEKLAVVTALTQQAADGQAKLSSTGGQTVLRRLNRREYINSVRDLFGLNMTMFDPTTRFPRDQMVQHMDNIGDVLQTSGFLLAQYLDTAEQVVEKAFRTVERPQEQTWIFTNNFFQQPELKYSHGKVFQHRYLCLYETTTSDKPEGAYGPLHGLERGVPADGWYEIKVKAEARNRLNPYEPGFFGTDREAPFRLALVPGNEKIGSLHLQQPIEPVLGEVVLKDEVPEWYTFKVWLDAGFTPRFTFPNGMVGVRGAYSRVLRKYNSSFPPEVRNTTGIVEARVVTMRYGFLPHIRIHEVEVRGPLVEQWPPAGQQAVLGGKPFAPERMREILEGFATRAYRRPAQADEVDRLMTVATSRVKEGHTPFEGLKDGLKAALCSPAFIYLAEPKNADAKTNGLSTYALASRLSYFLWSTTPDAELTRLAQNGKLAKREVLVAQTRRLLADARSEAFVNGFLDSWLNLRSLGDMAPDRGEFLRYYSQNLQPAMKQETQMFMRHLIDENLSIVQFLDSDYTFANRPLAKLYGMGDAVSAANGHEFRQIKFTTPQRGGLLGQGSVLTVSANGVETSPVTRGVWILENLLGTPPAPPPDNVPPIDPDVRGAASMRELLTKHRNNPACFECHRKIDPLGFALESFDPIGAWRSKYEKGAAIDTAGELPGGQAFQDVAGLKKILVERKDQFARMLTERLLGYACGRRVEPLDRPEVNHLVKEVAGRGYGLRDMIELAVTSKVFQTK